MTSAFTRALQDRGLFLSPFVHYFVYKIRKGSIRFERAMLIVSIDVDVGNRKVGAINNGKNDLNVDEHFSEYAIGEMEEQALPLIIDFFNNLGIPATFGIRGQLLKVDTSILEQLQDSPVQHDIGAHGYYHRDFKRLSYNEAEDELKLTSDTMKNLKVTPKSFIFPRAHVAHLELLEKYGYKCYRGFGDFMNDGMYIRKQGLLYDVHPSLCIGYASNSFPIKKIIDLAIKNRLSFHVWFHPWNLGKDKNSMKRKIGNLYSHVFKYGKSKERQNLLEFETMLSAAEKAGNLQAEGSG